MAAQVVVPQLGESVVEARVARWRRRRKATQVAVGDPRCVELETEKIDLEVNADQAGALAKIPRQEGEDVKGRRCAPAIEAGAAADASSTGRCARPGHPAPPEATTPAVAAAPAGAADGAAQHARPRARPPKSTRWT